MATRMSNDDMKNLGAILRGWLGYDSIPAVDEESSRGIPPRRAGRSYRALAKAWGIKHPTVVEILKGRRSIGAELAIRILRDLQPSESELERFLTSTHLDTVLDELSGLVRQAGFQSALTRRTGLLWSERVANLSRLRRDEGRRVLSLWTQTYHADSAATHELLNIVKTWEQVIDDGDLTKAYNMHYTFHEKITSQLSNFDISTYTNANFRVHLLSQDLRADPLLEPTGYVEDYSSKEEAEQLLIFHRNLVTALVQHDEAEIDLHWSRHSDWRLPRSVV